MTDRGSDIRQARKMRRESIRDVAEATGVSMRTIGRVERGEVNDSHNLVALERYLKPQLDKIDAERGMVREGDISLRQANFTQTLAHLAKLHAQLTAELADAIRLGQPVDADEVREWRTEDAPSTKRVTGEADQADPPGQEA